MKYLTGLMLLLLIQIASATECRVNGGNWFDAETRGFNVYVNVKANLSLGKIVLDGYTMDCRHGLPTYWPYNSSQTIVTYPDAVRLLPQYSHLNGGLSTGGGVYHPIPVRAGIVLSVQGAEPQVSVAGRPYLNITTTPGKYIDIKSGTMIAVLHLSFRSYSFGSLVKEFTTLVNVFARNSLNMSPSTCTINNNNPINVDFGSVDPLAVGGDIPAGTPYKRSVVLNYSCPDLGISSPIDIKLAGTASSFNSSALVTTNPNLAAGMHRLSALVAPGGSFRTSISNSSGSDTVLFTLFRKPGSLPAAGPFTASATLVMSVP